MRTWWDNHGATVLLGLLTCVFLWTLTWLGPWLNTPMQFIYDPSGPPF